MPATRSSGTAAVADRDVSVSPTVQAEPVGDRAAGRIVDAAGVERRQRRRPVAGHEREPAVGRQVRADDRRGVDAHAPEGDVERAIGLTRATPGDRGELFGRRPRRRRSAGSR